LSCRLKGDRRTSFIAPPGWRYEGSVTAIYGLLYSHDSDHNFKYNRHGGEVPLYINLVTGQKLYLGRAVPSLN
jgi:hypothetical protein